MIRYIDVREEDLAEFFDWADRPRPDPFLDAPNLGREYIVAIAPAGVGIWRVFVETGLDAEGWRRLLLDVPR